MELLSVNIGVPRSNPWKRGLEITGIDKRPVTGPVAVSAPGPKGTGAVGLAGDRVYDIRHHGGSDQAVYAYAREDLDFWESRLGRRLPAGVFGENLTTAGADINSALVGERWRVGSDVVLEAACPRIPCGTFRGWIDEKGWLKTFTAEGRIGVYLRVVEPGEISPGDPIEVIDRPDHDVTIALTFRAIHDETLLPRLRPATALPAPLRQRVADHDG